MRPLASGPERQLALDAVELAGATGDLLTTLLEARDGGSLVGGQDLRRDLVDPESSGH